ncbi:hypothetical protein [Burkholderia pseudomallei]|uniref:hypothetical protein n=1 Tax=Burkholderia pseudomallei TaxID=28450 RepID=UPI0013923C34|nr:hypothetical protein [Burkholderia pseudomallei]
MDSNEPTPMITAPAIDAAHAARLPAGSGCARVNPPRSARIARHHYADAPIQTINQTIFGGIDRSILAGDKTATLTRTRRSRDERIAPIHPARISTQRSTE